ncbi:MAG: GNAT family N-acetyltransferase [Myxococcales bacterium]|nr:GNAT family N-acetyltransferase [Myxococcales bacterium]
MASLAPNPVVVPIIETARLRLRGHRKADLDACYALWSDPDVVRHIGGVASPKDAVWMRLVQYVGHWALNGYGYWLVEDRASGRFVGEVGVADFMREVDPPIDGVPEAGWVISPWAQNRGHATEALTAVLAWAHDHLDDPEIACLIDPANAPSLRVAAKADFREVAQTAWRGHPSVVLRRPARRAVAAP